MSASKGTHDALVSALGLVALEIAALADLADPDERGGAIDEAMASALRHLGACRALAAKLSREGARNASS